MQYHMDLTKFGMEEFKRILQTTRLLPSEGLLRDNLDERFSALAALGIGNVSDLLYALRTKKRLAQCACQSGIPSEYLVVLRRHAGMYTPKPIRLEKFPGIAEEHIERLAFIGIRDTKQLLEHALTPEARTALSAAAKVPFGILLELVKLSDLVRAPYVGAVWARLFYEAGVDTLERLARSDPDALCERVRLVNERHNITKGGLLTSTDMASSLAIYHMIPAIVQYV